MLDLKGNLEIKKTALTAVFLLTSQIKTPVDNWLRKLSLQGFCLSKSVISGHQFRQKWSLFWSLI